MASRLINVRLAPQDAARADALMARGVEISQIVRDAIRREYDRQRVMPKTTKDVRKILAKIYAQHPAPADPPPHFEKSSDRKAAREYIKAKLRRKRS